MRTPVLGAVANVVAGSLIGEPGAQMLALSAGLLLVRSRFCLQSAGAALSNVCPHAHANHPITGR